MRLTILRCLIAVTALGVITPGLADDDVHRPVAAMLGNTPSNGRHEVFAKRKLQ